MHHKPINPARRDGGGDRGKDGELGTEGIQKEKDIEGEMDNGKQRNESRKTQRESEMEGKDQEGAERKSEVKGSEIQRDRERKNKCKPPRINSLISLWERMKKKRISTSYPLSLALISLSLSLSFCLIF